MNFILRPWKESDIDSVAKYANNKKIADNLRDAFPWPYTHEDARGYVLSCLAAGEARQCTRAIDVDGEAVGSIGIFLEEDVYCKNAELGFAHYDLARIHAEPFAHNFGSRRALEKAGYRLEGILKKRVFKNAEIFDSCLYAFTR